ncbi:unnamed protein product [Penicillium bialowiezense]
MTLKTLPWDLEAADVPFVARLAKIGFDFDFSETFQNPWARDSLVLLLPRLDTVIQASEIEKLFCRENAAELRLALQDKRLSPNGHIDRMSVLECAIGWPEGVQILLESGADPRQDFMLPLIYFGEGRQTSAEILLRAGCIIHPMYLRRVFQFNLDEERMILLVKHLAERRKKLRYFAEMFLPLDLIPGSGEKKLLDGSDCRKVLELLSDHKVSLPHPFAPKAEQFLALQDDTTVYHDQSERRSAEELYRAGFLDTDRLDSKGRSPLASLGAVHFADFPQRSAEIIRWHISKGANLYRQLAWANESVSHLLTLVMIERCFYGGCRGQSSRATLESELQELVTMGDDFFAPTRVPDGCSCPCSPGGCTAVSAILRELTSDLWPRSNSLDHQRKVFDFVYEWDLSYWQEPRAIIRSLTFNALDLTHTCFASIRKGDVVSKNGSLENLWYFDDRDNEEWSLNEFEDLLTDLEQKFVETCQPLKDFLPNYWYRRVKDHLLTRQPDDEKHVKGARGVGVELEFCGLSVPDWMDNCIARKVEELNDEEAVNEQRG